MGLDRPYDFAVMFGIFALIAVWGGFWLAAIQAQGVTEDTTFFSTIHEHYNGTTGLRSTGQDIAGTLSEGDEGEQTEDSFLVRAGRGLLKLGGSFKTMEEATGQAAGEIGIPEEYIGIMSAVMLIIFGVVLYTWWRGK